MPATNPAPKVRIGLGTILSTLAALGGGYAAAGSAISQSVSSIGTIRWAGITALVVITIHGFRSWQANGHLKNIPYYAAMVNTEHAIARYLPGAVSVIDRLAPAIAVADPALAPELTAVETIVADLPPVVDPGTTPAPVPPAAPTTP